MTNPTSEELLQILQDLTTVIESRKQAATSGDSESSYVAKLFAKGDDAILKKVGEEAAETIMAAKDCRQSNLKEESLKKHKALLVGEVADLWFHSMILLVQMGLRPEDVLLELKRREGVSGIVEKASRSGA